MTLLAGEGGIVATGAAGFILEADAGITLNDVLTTVAGSVQIDADVDNASGGTLTTGEPRHQHGRRHGFDYGRRRGLSGHDQLGVASTTIIDSDGTGIGLGGTSVGLESLGARTCS